MEPQQRKRLVGTTYERVSRRLLLHEGLIEITHLHSFALNKVGQRFSVEEELYVEETKASHAVSFPRVLRAQVKQ